MRISDWSSDVCSSDLLGQGTVGLEIEADLPDCDTLLVATGGGGLIGGIAAWFAGRIRIVAVEPEGAPTLFKALAAGRPVDAEAEGIAAYSLAPKQVGRLRFPLAQAYVERSEEHTSALQSRMRIEYAV